MLEPERRSPWRAPPPASRPTDRSRRPAGRPPGPAGSSDPYRTAHRGPCRRPASCRASAGRMTRATWPGTERNRTRRPPRHRSPRPRLVARAAIRRDPADRSSDPRCHPCPASWHRGVTTRVGWPPRPRASTAADRWSTRSRPADHHRPSRARHLRGSRRRGPPVRRWLDAVDPRRWRPPSPRRPGPRPFRGTPAGRGERVVVLPVRTDLDGRIELLEAADGQRRGVAVELDAPGLPGGLADVEGRGEPHHRAADQLHGRHDEVRAADPERRAVHGRPIGLQVPAPGPDRPGPPSMVVTRVSG